MAQQTTTPTGQEQRRHMTYEEFLADPRGRASRLLDAGASGIVAPMINTADDARRFGAFMKYPPLGERSWGPQAALSLCDLSPDAYFAQANRFAMGSGMATLAIVAQSAGGENFLTDQCVHEGRLADTR